MYSSKNILGVNPVMMNYKTRCNKNRPATRPARYTLVWPDRFFGYSLWWQKNRKKRSGHVRLRAKVAMEEGLLTVWICQRIGQSWSVNEYCYNLGFARTRSHILCSCYRSNEEWWSRKCFLANYINKGDSWKFSTANDSQHMVDAVVLHMLNIDIINSTMQSILC